MIEAVNLLGLIPGAASARAALLIYWAIATANWLPLDTNKETQKDEAEVGVATKLITRADKMVILREAGKASAQAEMALKKMGVKPKRYQTPDMIAELKKLVKRGSKAGLKRDTASTKARLETDAEGWDKWVRAQPDLQYVVWDSGTPNVVQHRGPTLPHTQTFACLTLTARAAAPTNPHRSCRRDEQENPKKRRGLGKPSMQPTRWDHKIERLRRQRSFLRRWSRACARDHATPLIS